MPFLKQGQISVENVKVGNGVVYTLQRPMKLLGWGNTLSWG